MSIADLNPGRDVDGRFARQVVDRLAPVLRIARALRNSMFERYDR